jgi:hypothetical protein
MSFHSRRLVAPAVLCLPLGIHKIGAHGVTRQTGRWRHTATVFTAPIQKNARTFPSARENSIVELKLPPAVRHLPDALSLRARGAVWKAQYFATAECAPV